MKTSSVAPSQATPKAKGAPKPNKPKPKKGAKAPKAAAAKKGAKAPKADNSES